MSSDARRDVTRRQALLGAASGLVSLTGAGGLVALAATVGCKKPQFACTDVTGLSAEDAQGRVALEYADQTLQSGKSCMNCQQWVAPSGDACGGCKVLKGPVHPNGFCKVYAFKG